MAYDNYISDDPNWKPPTNKDGAPVMADDLAAQHAAERQEAAEIAAGRDAPIQARLAPSADAVEANRAREAPYQYGGWAGGAAEAAGRYAGLGSAAQGRPGEVINYEQSNWDRMQAGNARNAQLSMADMMARRARGDTPSIAGMMANRQMGQAAAEQSSAAASARGPAGLALAQQGAAANTANMQSNISNQAQINAANERMQAEQNAMGAFSGIRGGDMQSGAMAGQQAQAQAALNAQQRAQNDQYQLGMTGYEVGVQGQQLAAQQNKVAAASGAYFNQQGLNLAKDKASDDRTAMWVGGAAGVAAAAVPVVASIFSPGGGGGGGGGVGDSATGGSIIDGNAVNTGDSMSGGSGSTGSALGMPPDPIDSDERAKVPVTWGSGAAAPPADPQGPPTGLDMSKAIARRALDEQEAGETQKREQAQAPQAQARGVKQATAIDGMAALNRRDEEDLGLIYAKERNGAELTEHEKSSKMALRRRVEGVHKEQQSRASMRGAPAQPQQRQAPSHTGEYVRAAGGAIGAIGQALGRRSGGDTGFHYTPTPMLQAPPPMQSDMTSKVPVRDLGDVDAPGFNPPVSADPQMQKASGMLQAQQVSTGALMGAGPSTAGAANRYTMPSDAAAKRAAFLDGMNHADEMQRTGEVPEAPSYMPRGPRAPAHGGVREMHTHNLRSAAGKESSKPWVDEETEAAPEREADVMTGPRGYATAAGGRAAGSEVSRAQPAPPPQEPVAAPVAPQGFWPSMSGYLSRAKSSMPSDERTKSTGKSVLSTLSGGLLFKDEAKKKGHQDAERAERPDKASTPDDWHKQVPVPAPKNTPDDEHPWSMPSDEKTKVASKQGHRARHGRGVDMPREDLGDIESLGPSGEGNAGVPDYNFIKSGSPLDVATALEADPGAITPQTEAYMRREGLWTSKTDALLRDRNLRQGGGNMPSDEKTKVGNLGAEVDERRMAEAARSMRSVPYAYKPAFAARAGQRPGELNVGPVAQEMEKSEVAGTAVEKDPQTGMRSIDIPKYTKVLGGVAASQEKRLEKLESLMARRLGSRR